MKKILIISFTFLFFGFTPEYYTHENTDVVYGKKLQEGYEDATVVDKTGKPISGIFISYNKKRNSIRIYKYAEGKRNGESVSFSNMPTHLMIPMKNNQIDGAVRYYSIDNQTLNINDYIVSDNFSDIITGIEKMKQLFAEKGHLSKETQYKNGQKHGTETDYHNSEGSASRIAHYLDGELNGIEKESFNTPEGILTIETSYLHGYKNGLEKTFINGILISEIE